jgi:hypothetical protein
MKPWLLVSLLLVFALPFLAQEQQTEEPEPYTREDNECYEGGMMEGRCNQDMDGDGIVSQAEIDWAWNCGWYIARYNDGVFSLGQVPSWCLVLLPRPVEHSVNPTTGLAPVNCTVAVVSGVSGTWCFQGIVLTADFNSDGTIDQIYYVVPAGDPCPPMSVAVTQVANFISPIGPWLSYENGIDDGSMVCKFN